MIKARQAGERGLEAQRAAFAVILNVSSLVPTLIQTIESFELGEPDLQKEGINDLYERWTQAARIRIFVHEKTNEAFEAETEERGEEMLSKMISEFQEKASLLIKLEPPVSWS